ncbi:hypothetical protein P8452_06400 [Trifolium repens]|nr:hypothetical protein P8452_06400 [Trifolium repens]
MVLNPNYTRDGARDTLIVLPWDMQASLMTIMNPFISSFSISTFESRDNSSSSSSLHIEYQWLLLLL